MKLIYRNQSEAQKLLNCMLLIAFLAIVVAYIMAVMNKNHVAWLPFISELDQYEPEGRVWTFGLTFAGIISIPIWMKLYRKWDKELRASNADKKWLKANMLVFVMAQIATVSLIWCVNLPFNEYPVPHGITAGVYFWLILSVGTLTILIVRKIDNYPKDLIRIRIGMNVAGYACMILMGAFVPEEMIEAINDPNSNWADNHDHAVHGMAALFEWLMVFIAHMGYFYTFNYDLEGETIQ